MTVLQLFVTRLDEVKGQSRGGGSCSIPVKSNLAPMSFKHNRDGDQRSRRAKISMNADEPSFVWLITRALVVRCVVVLAAFCPVLVVEAETERKNKGSVKLR